MPSKWAQVVIVLFWVMMTGWLVKRDVLPRMGFGELTYRSLLADRAVEERSNWNIALDGESIGTLSTTVRPNGNGSFLLMSRASLNRLPFETGKDSSLGRISLNSDFAVTPLGRLDHFEVQVRLDESQIRVDIEGRVEKETLVVVARGLPLFSEPLRIPLDPESLTVDIFGSIDRLPGLRIGQKWATRAVNPFGSLLSPSALLGNVKPSVEVIHNTVKDIDVIRWNGEPVRCYLVEHHHPTAVAHSWVRTKDGMVLRQQVPLAGWLLALENAPLADP